jgi:hypothetical protein
VEELKTDLEKGTFFGRRHLFGTIGKKRRNQYPLRKLERRIWLTEKKTTGLFTAGFLLCGLCAGMLSMQADGRETPLPVISIENTTLCAADCKMCVRKMYKGPLAHMKQELFEKEGLFELSVGLTDCETGEKQERIFYIRGGGPEGAAEAEKGK